MFHSKYEKASFKKIWIRITSLFLYHKRVSTKVFLISRVKRWENVCEASAYKQSGARTSSLDVRRNETRSAKQKAEKTFIELQRHRAAHSCEYGWSFFTWSYYFHMIRILFLLGPFWCRDLVRTKLAFKIKVLLEIIAWKKQF